MVQSLHHPWMVDPGDASVDCVIWTRADVAEVHFQKWRFIQDVLSSSEIEAKDKPNVPLEIERFVAHYQGIPSHPIPSI